MVRSYLAVAGVTIVALGLSVVTNCGTTTVAGTGGTTIEFVGTNFGNDVIDPPSGAGINTLDFSRFGGLVTLNLASTATQTVSSASKRGNFSGFCRAAISAQLAGHRPVSITRANSSVGICENRLRTLEAAKNAGADVLVLCDTNGGMMTGQLAQICAEVRSRFDGVLGIHTHNDCELGVANELAAVEQGFAHVQGCMNGYGRSSTSSSSGCSASRSTRSRSQSSSPKSNHSRPRSS